MNTYPFKNRHRLYREHKYLLCLFITLLQKVATHDFGGLAGIEIPESHIHFDVYENPRGNLSVEGGISYRGPLQRRGSLSRIKLDLTNDEKIVLKPEWFEINQPYHLTIH